MKIRIIHFTGTIALSIILTGCFINSAIDSINSKITGPKVCIYESAFTQQKGTFTDQRDNKTYEIVEIGTQTWMAENLNYEAEGSKCSGEGGKVAKYNEKGGVIDFTTLSPAEIQANCGKYGRLYDWVTAMGLSCSGRCDPRFNPSLLKQVTTKHKGICPDGWHIPSNDEWATLTNFVGDKGGTKLKSSDGWDMCNGSDNYGFAALPGGSGINHRDGTFTFNGVGNGGDWWTATGFASTSGGIIVDSYSAYVWRMTGGPYFYEYVRRFSDFVGIDLNSIRCVQN